jgi:lipopolysaccharide export system protein LptA
MGKTKSKKIFGGHRFIIFVILCLFGLCLVQSKGRKARHNQPKVDNKVYLLHADQLRYNQMRNADAQILNGHVSFLHKGAYLFCDSAYFYQSSNSFEAFGHVKMRQGDTLTLNSDYAFYDGNEQMAQARYNVVLNHRGSRLYTDSLNFDRLYKIGYFFEGGKLIDKGNVLTSDWGEYSTDTRKAVFNYMVKLRNKKFVLTTDTLHYDASTSIANITGPSNIKSGKSTVYTERGYYDTKSDRVRLFDRSVIKNEGKTIVGDSVYYDNKRGVSKAFHNVVYTDMVNKNKMTGDYCYYNEKTGYAMGTNKAVVMDFSRPDTLYIHADTLKLFTHNIKTDSVYRIVRAYHKVRIFRNDVQGVCDSLLYNSKDSCISMYSDPILWNQNQQLLGEVIKVYMNDSTVNWAHVIGQALSVQQMSDTTKFNQIASTEMKAFFVHGDIHEGQAIDNVKIIYYPIDDSDTTIIGLNYTETSKMKIFLKNKKMEKIWMPEAAGTLYPITQIPTDKKFLPSFAWFNYIRPKDKNDIFKWRGKSKGQMLLQTARHEAPLRSIAKPKVEKK